MRIVEGDNFDGDYPDETFLNIPSVPKLNALEIAMVINAAFPTHYPRYWRAVEDDYKLQPAFTRG